MSDPHNHGGKEFAVACNSSVRKGIPPNLLEKWIRIIRTNIQNGNASMPDWHELESLLEQLQKSKAEVQELLETLEGLCEIKIANDDGRKDMLDFIAHRKKINEGK